MLELGEHLSKRWRCLSSLATTTDRIIARLGRIAGRPRACGGFEPDMSGYNARLGSGASGSGGPSA